MGCWCCLAWDWLPFRQVAGWASINGWNRACDIRHRPVTQRAYYTGSYRIGRVKIMVAIRRGILTGLFAGLVLAMLDVVVNGAPGNGLQEVLRWFGITFADAGLARVAGFALVIALGGVFGILFGLIFNRLNRQAVSIARAIPLGLLLGFAWWLLLSQMLCNVANHISPFSFTFTGTLLTLPLNLVFGIVLGTAYYQFQAKSETS